MRLKLLILGWLAVFALVMAGSMWVAHANPTSVLTGTALAEVEHFLFLSEDGNPLLTVLDITSDKPVGTLELGLAPSRIEVSKASRKLAAIDGQSSRLVVADLAHGGKTELDLGFPAQRLALSPDGRRLAVADMVNGKLALVDLETNSVIARTDGLPPLRDLMFNAEGSRLYAAGSVLTVLDLANALARHTLATAVTGFTRSPDGHALFLKEPDGAVTVLNAKTERPLARLPQPAGSPTPVPSATGAYLLLPDNSRQTLDLIHGDTLERGNSFPALPDLATAYTGWFDSVAVLPSPSQHKLMLIDLWRQSRLKDIDLPAAPLAGAVSADGAKLYLPLDGKAKLAIIDLRNRKLDSILTLPHPVKAAFLADSYGICH